MLILKDFDFYSERFLAKQPIQIPVQADLQPVQADLQSAVAEYQAVGGRLSLSSFG